MKVLLSICYDGSNYFGWQRQPELNTVQREIEKALSTIYNKDIYILGASRTDTGVHALDQKAIFTIDQSNVPIEKLYLLLNKILPSDIVIKSSIIVKDTFHPMAHVVKKTYKYTIYNGTFKNPLYRNYSTFVDKPLDSEKMALALKEFEGTYDFVAFCKNAKIKDNTIRTIYETSLYRENDFIYFTITGNGFLHNMVRTIAHTLIDVGTNKIQLCDVKNIILSKDRSKSSRTADGNGLCLHKIYLDEENL